MRRPRHDGGFGFIEAMMAAATFAAILGTLVAVLRTATQQSTLIRSESTLQEKAAEASYDIAREVAWARAGTLLLTTVNGSSQLRIEVPLGWDGVDVVWSSPITYRFETSNVDADGDGLLDDGAIVREQDGVTRVLCNYVRPGGFDVDIAGSTVAIEVQLAMTDAARRVLDATGRATVVPRN